MLGRKSFYNTEVKPVDDVEADLMRYLIRADVIPILSVKLTLSTAAHTRINKKSEAISQNSNTRICLRRNE